MNDEPKSIHEFDFNLICEYFSALDRQGPGSPEVTLRALNYVDNLTGSSRIADIGCGTGGQTLNLARHAPGTITAIDLFPAFIEKLNENAGKNHLDHRIKGIVGTMEDLPFQDEELDLIWAEGSIYNIGFERGLKEWNRFLKKGGYIGITEVSWFTTERPEEIQKFWDDAYTGIDLISKKVEQMERAGYVPVATFILPDICWLDNFYTLQEPAQELFLKKYPDNETAIGLISYLRQEVQMYNKYKEFYGYVFFVGKKL